jgi:DNA-binding HxlR family transcriptional regulator
METLLEFSKKKKFKPFEPLEPKNQKVFENFQTGEEIFKKYKSDSEFITFFKLYLSFLNEKDFSILDELKNNVYISILLNLNKTISGSTFKQIRRELKKEFGIQKEILRRLNRMIEIGVVEYGSSEYSNKERYRVTKAGKTFAEYLEKRLLS